MFSSTTTAPTATARCTPAPDGARADRGTHPRLAWRLRSTALALLAAAVLAPPALAQSNLGAAAFGFATGSFDIGCTTCSHMVLTLTGDPAPNEGGNGAASAAFNYVGTPDRALSLVSSDYTLGGGVSMAAVAQVVGPLGTPLLGARAGADNVPAFIVVNPGVQIGVDYYGATAQAEVVQRYTFTGTQATTYTFTFHVDGSASDRRAMVSAASGFYDDFLEVNYAFNSVSVTGTALVGAPENQPGVLNESFSVAMTFNPGDSYLMRTWLSAGVVGEYASGMTSAEAMHTLSTTSVTGGDTSLLLASVAAVPEPATTASLLAGLALLGSWRLRRRR